MSGSKKADGDFYVNFVSAQAKQRNEFMLNWDSKEDTGMAYITFPAALSDDRCRDFFDDLHREVLKLTGLKVEATDPDAKGLGPHSRAMIITPPKDKTTWKALKEGIEGLCAKSLADAREEVGNKMKIPGNSEPTSRPKPD
jgi:hypothetical protein